LAWQTKFKAISRKELPIEFTGIITVSSDINSKDQRIEYQEGLKKDKITSFKNNSEARSSSLQNKICFVTNNSHHESPKLIRSSKEKQQISM